MNILFEYLYRDAGNNKKWGEVVFSNDAQIDLAALNNKIKNALIDGEFFIADKSCLPKIGFDKKNELDHEWYEFSKISLTRKISDDPLSRDISEFISALKESSKLVV